MKKEELENEMLGDVVCSLENFQFAIYTGLKGPGSITATTDIYGKYKDSAQEFKDMDDLLNNFIVSGRPLKEILPMVDVSQLD